MTLNPIINFAIRGFQGLCAIIILGLSVDLVKGHKYGDLPATLGFAAFAAGLSIVGVIIGVATTWVEILQGIIGAAIDVVVAIVNLVAGVLIAIKLKGIDCSNGDQGYRFVKLNKVNILNGGCPDNDPRKCIWWVVNESKLNSRCKQSQADMAFMFIICVALVISAALTFLKSR